MSNFIELNFVNGGKKLVNVSLVLSVIPSLQGCNVTVRDGAAEKTFHTLNSYESVIDFIRQHQGT